MAALMSLLKRKSKKSAPPEQHATPSPAPSVSSSSSHHSRTTTRQQIIDELQQVFKKFDANGDGKISSSELGSIMRSLGNGGGGGGSTVPDEDELCRMIKEVDADGDGYIDLDEFIALNTKGVDQEEVMVNLKEAFSVYDIDGNGRVTAEELQMVMKSLGDNCSIGECRKMIRGVDFDGDGTIDFEEFKEMMMVSGGPRFSNKRE